MLSPNATANTSTGMSPKTADPGPGRPSRRPPMPNWNTSTMSPNVAAIESRFMRMAFIGTSTERNTIEEDLLHIQHFGGIPAHRDCGMPQPLELRRAELSCAARDLHRGCER